MDSQGSLGHRIRSTRIRRGLSQAQLALPELSDSYVSLIESGKRIPTPDVVRLLARKLGCSASYLSSGIDEDAQDRMRVTLEYAEIALQNGEAAEARDRLTELLADPDLASLPEYARRARWGHALALEATGELEEALHEFAALTAVLSPDYDTEEWIRLNIAMSRCHREKGDAARSVAVAEGAFARVTAKAGPWSDETVKLGATLVGAYLERGDLVSGGQLADRLIEHADAMGSSVARMAAYWEAAIVARYQADFEKAVAYGERALALLGEAADLRNLSRLRGEYGTLMLLARPDEAERARDELQRATREMTATAAGGIDIARCLTELARAELAMGQPRKAADRADEALKMLGPEPRPATAGALIVLGEARIRLGREEDAADVLGQAMTCLQQMEPSREVAEGWFNLAELLSETGDDEHRAEAYRHALSCAGL
ncbi:helix-turn-helix transcriptional regulator [Actinomadura sp. DC4]|uniref:helix-turn-helix domain-containing protein n=1 Tax=Actinomadura sp. DC4 TaxID=3055069 RepID=UPI0025B10470|nr:helix-turn-helix transcriptional regulator [Actinomadura sp. DC4]MDN3353304.1 helix-turn-helix transcriptional regulator [Actinomadura sp. DC4]